MIPISLRWQGDATGHLELIDQTLLPGRLKWIACRDVDTLIEAIALLRVRGAPAIGIAGAYGVAVAASEAPAPASASLTPLKENMVDTKGGGLP